MLYRGHPIQDHSDGSDVGLRNGYGGRRNSYRPIRAPDARRMLMRIGRHYREFQKSESDGHLRLAGFARRRAAVGRSSGFPRGIKLAVRDDDATIEFATTNRTRRSVRALANLIAAAFVVSQVVAGQNGSIRLGPAGAAAWFILVGLAMWLLRGNE